MDRLKLLVISADDESAFWLAKRLSPSAFDVTGTLPGPHLITAVRELRPQVVVLEGIDARPGTAEMEVALVKDQLPEAQIIAMSGRSTEIDARVIEQGVFFYLADGSREELLRVIVAAARERQESSAQVRPEPAR